MNWTCHIKGVPSASGRIAIQRDRVATPNTKGSRRCSRDHQSTMEDLIKVLERVTLRLSNLSIPQLVQVCSHLDVDAGDKVETQKDRLRIVRRLLTHINSEEVEESDDGGVELLQTLDSFIKNLNPESQDVPVSPNPTQKKDDTSSPSKLENLEPSKTQPSATPTEMARLLRREFKVSGQIGEPGQKDRLSFTSLANQIETGLEKGYPDRDVVQGVIRAIAPGLSLRSYLEGRSKIPLPSLRRIIRSHYQERDATDLYKQLSQLTQGAGESAQAFLLKAFDTRQKVLFASQESDSRLCYDPHLVQEMFRHAILTGLRSDAIKTELRPYLDDPKTSDEVLFEKMNVFSSLEDERRQKLTQSRSTTLNEVFEAKEQQTKTPKPGLLMTEIAELKAGIAELSSLKGQVAALQESLQKTPQQQPSRFKPSSSRVRRGCHKCQEAGTGSDCDHCFKCGSSDHFAVGCRKARVSTKQGNEVGLRPRDRE